MQWCAAAKVLCIDITAMGLLQLHEGLYACMPGLADWIWVSVVWLSGVPESVMCVHGLLQSERHLCYVSGAG